MGRLAKQGDWKRTWNHRRVTSDIYPFAAEGALALRGWWGPLQVFEHRTTVGNLKFHFLSLVNEGGYREQSMRGGCGIGKSSEDFRKIWLRTFTFSTIANFLGELAISSLHHSIRLRILHRYSWSIFFWDRNILLVQHRIPLPPPPPQNFSDLFQRISWNRSPNDSMTPKGFFT